MKTYQFVIICIIGLLAVAALHGRKFLKKPCGCGGNATGTTDETTGG